MSTVMVRVERESHRTLKAISARTGQPMQDILAMAIEQYRRTRILKETNEAFARLRTRAVDWKAEQSERRLWESALADGLENR